METATATTSALWGRVYRSAQGTEITISYHHNFHVTKGADAAAQQVQRIPRCVISSHGLSCFQGRSCDGGDKSLPVISLKELAKVSSSKWFCNCIISF